MPRRVIATKRCYEEDSSESESEHSGKRWLYMTAVTMKISTSLLKARCVRLRYATLT